jgi:glycerol-3-phosphate dehydrogenase
VKARASTPPADGVDLVVVGGGIHGAAAAYEASRRGLSVLLVEQGDFGCGASSQSLRIAHGGLRYLQSLDVRRSLDSLAERRRLLTLAPHLVRPLRCRLEADDSGPLGRLALRAGWLVNDALSWRRNRGVPARNRLPRGRFPEWWDAILLDTERLLLAFVQTAEALGGGRVRALNHTRLEGLVHADGRVVAARVAGRGEVRAGCVLDCTGAGAARRVVLCMNVVVGPLALNAGGVARALRHPGDGRRVFCVPWRGRSIVGTFERPYLGAPAAPLRTDPAWLDELLAWLRPVHPELARLGPADVHGVHAGLLPADADGSPARNFEIAEDRPGLVRVQGVKWTTARGVASRAVRRAAARLGRADAARRGDDALPPLLDHRVALRDWLRRNPHGLRRVLPARSPLRVGHVLFAVECEQARTLSDVLLRRTAVATLGHPGPTLAAAVADVLARQLGWSPAERRAQLEAFDAEPAFLASHAARLPLRAVGAAS